MRCIAVVNDSARERLWLLLALLTCLSTALFDCAGIGYERPARPPAPAWVAR